MPMYQRPAFWRVPHQRHDPEDEPRNFGQRKLFSAMGRLHTFVVTLRRETRDTNWGLRLVGGADLATPLIVTRITPGTPAGRELARGDIIAKIDHYDARDLRHEDAQNLFKNAPNQIKLVVQRSSPSSHLYAMPHSPSYVGRVPTPTYYRMAEDEDREGPKRNQFAPRSPLANAVPPPFRTASPMPAPWRGPESLPRSTPVPPSNYSMPSQVPFQVQQEGEYRTLLLSPASNRTDETVDESIQSQRQRLETQSAITRSTTRSLPGNTMAVNPNFFPNGYQDPKHPDEEVVTNWPYRTTPLVLPGAKVRREPGPTESYLRHHPNPAMRAAPHHDYRDTLMKQKVVHKQFNSPINLYSEQNIANSIRQQTSPLPSNGHYGRPHVVKSHRPTVLYDPAKSETYRALQEDALAPGDVQEVPTPVQKVFSAPAPAAKKPAPAPKPTKQPESKAKQTTFVNSLQEEHIQQSNSFKRLMYNVLGDTEF